jgi:hypothetical protein
MEGKTIKGKAAYEKIKSLIKLKTDPENWIVYYFDEKTGEYWKLESLDPNYHGGGIPVLTKIDKLPDC